MPLLYLLPTGTRLLRMYNCRGALCPAAPKPGNSRRLRAIPLAMIRFSSDCGPSPIRIAGSQPAEVLSISAGMGRPWR